MQPLLNGSIPSSLQHGPLVPRIIVGHYSVVTYFNANRKKIFLLLCAFITGTWIGSSLPNYRQFGGLQAPCLTSDKRTTASMDMITSRYMAMTTTTTPLQKNNSSSSSGHIELTTDGPYLPEDPNYLVYTSFCRIPRFDPRDPTVLNTIKSLEPLNCAKSSPRFTFMKGNVLRVDTSSLSKEYGLHSSWSCCYSQLQRSGEGKTDDGYSISTNCTSIEEGVNVTLTNEFVKVICKSTNVNDKNKHFDFVYTVPLKPSVEERLSKLESTTKKPKSSQLMPFSVMLFGLDAVSRLNFERHLVRTRHFLLDELHAIEMLGYNKVGDNTFPNLAALLTGYSKEELLKTCWKDDSHHSLDNCSFAWSRFSELGYRTLYGEDSHSLSTFNYLKEGFYKQPTDYYFRPFSLASEKEIALSKMSNTRLCLGSRPIHEVSIGWGRDFMEVMGDKLYFGLVWSNSLTHDEANFVQRADPFLFDMLVDLRDKELLNNTVLIFISDHGIRWGALRRTRIGGYEERLPALFISLPPRFRTEFPVAVDNLRRNSRRLTSTFDLHKTLLALASLGTGNVEQFYNASGMSLTNDPLVASRGISLFDQVPFNRSCLHAGINGHWCACEENVPMDAQSSLALAIARHIVQHVNYATLPKRSLCAYLELGEVNSFMQKSSVEIHEKVKHHFRYTITLRVTPSEAVFEATILTDENKEEFKLEEDIIRVNKYGNQSSCVNELSLKPFCYCETQQRSRRSPSFATGNNYQRKFIWSSSSSSSSVDHRESSSTTRSKRFASL